MQQFSMLIKPASSNCNLRCKYCFYADIADKREKASMGIMTQELTDSLLNCVFNSLCEETQIHFAFQGGEPTCAGLSYFEYFINRTKELKKDIHHISYSIQTNGTLLDDRWISFLKENDFLVGVSLDGFPSNNDNVRVDVSGNGTFAKITEKIKKLESAGVPYNILTVLTPKLSGKADRLYKFYKEQGYEYVQLIPCLPPLGEKSMYALKPEDFFRFYDRFFKLWYEDLLKGSYMSVTYFDNIIPLFKGMRPGQCGYLGSCSMQYVTEADGSVYPCDFFCLDKYRVGNVKENTLQEMFESSVTKAFLTEKREKSSLCNTCRYEGICHGQCRRLSECYYTDNYCALQKFMTKYEKELRYAADLLIGR